MPLPAKSTCAVLTTLTTLAGLATALVLLLAPAPSHAVTRPVDVYPTPGDQVASPSTQITFRGLPTSQFGAISVVGSKSGAHAGVIREDSDHDGGSFLPSTPFDAGETVTVRTGLDIVDGTNGTFHFTVADPAGQIHGAASVNTSVHVSGDVWRFASEPGLAAPAITVDKLPEHAAPGGIFVASQEGPVQNGPEIVGPYGGLVYFRPVPKGDSATDFTEQTYDGKPVLTWWQGRVSTGGVGAGEDEIVNDRYQTVATVKAGNGLSADLHEFRITSRNTALITAEYPVYWNASSVKGASRHEIVLDAVVQEIDIPTGLVLYQWDSLNHVPVSSSYVPPARRRGQPWDYFHINSIQPVRDGGLLLSSRNTWSIFRVSATTGAVQWTLGGKHSSFRLGSGVRFAFQHDARMLNPDILTVFDDGAGPPSVHAQSRALTLKLDTTHMTASVVSQDEHDPPLLANYEGNVQRLANGDDLVGWGQQPYITEFNAGGQEVFDARFVGATNTYRAYRFRWQGTPATPPSVAVHQTSRGRMVYASWDGATDTARWRVLGGPSPSKLTPIASAGKTGFETAIRIAHPYRFVEVQAIDPKHQTQRTSKPVAG